MQLVHRIALGSLLLSALPTVAEASSASRVHKLIDQGRIEDAQQRCTRMEVWTHEEQEVRNACARAYWPYYERLDTAQGWRDFQETWGETYLSDEAKRREALAAIQQADTPREAMAVAKRYPDHPDLIRLLERHLGAFVQLREQDGEVVAILEPEVPLPPGVEPEVMPAARLESGEVLPWDVAVERHLGELGLGSDFVERARDREGRTDFPVCPAPGLTPGLRVEVGEAEAFVPRVEEGSCTVGAQPVFFTVVDGQMASISFGPDRTLELATAGETFAWGEGPTATRVPVPFEAGDPIVLGPVVGQMAGDIYLLHPIAGGMPWYVAADPPRGALPLPGDLKTVQLPPGWTLSAGRQTVTPGERVRGRVEVQGPDVRPWTLPRGEPRVLSPIVQQLTGLHAEHPALERERAPALPEDPAAIGTDGPRGGDAIFHEESTGAAMERAEAKLRRMGFEDARIERAWSVRLTDDGTPDLVFTGRVAGERVKGVMDPMADGGGERVFLWQQEARSVEEEVPFAFEWNGRTYFAWRGPQHVEAVHAEEIGLVREMIAPETRVLGQVTGEDADRAEARVEPPREE